MKALASARNEISELRRAGKPNNNNNNEAKINGIMGYI